MKKIILGLGLLVASFGSFATNLENAIDQANASQEAMKSDVVLTCNYKNGDIVGDVWIWDDYSHKKAATVVRKNGVYFVKVSAYNSELKFEKTNHENHVNIYSGIDEDIIVLEDKEKGLFIVQVSNNRIFGIFDCK